MTNLEAENGPVGRIGLIKSGLTLETVIIVLTIRTELDTLSMSGGSRLTIFQVREQIMDRHIIIRLSVGSVGCDRARPRAMSHVKLR